MAFEDHDEDCMAKWSGVDEGLYRAYGCPSCKCGEGLEVLAGEGLKVLSPDTGSKILLAEDVAAGKPEWKPCPECEKKKDENDKLRAILKSFIAEEENERARLVGLVKGLLESVEYDLCKEANYECDYRIDGDDEYCPCQLKVKYGGK